MVLEVVKYPDQVLYQKSQKATFGKELEDLIKNMLDTMNSFKDPQAAGLSAVQIGVLWRVLIARDIVSAEKKEIITDHILINPKFISVSRDEELDWEGCLSFPDVYGKVWRSKKIKVKYQNLAGAEQRLTVNGFLARVIQHEMDHLNGLTFDTIVVGKMYKGEELERKAHLEAA